MLFGNKKPQNPFNFISMEKWCSEDARFQGFAATAKDGGIYLTWDVQKGIPVFSSGCKIGETMKLEDFNNFKELFSIVAGRWIVPVENCYYRILGFKSQYYFKKEAPVLHISTQTFPHNIALA